MKCRQKHLCPTRERNIPESIRSEKKNQYDERRHALARHSRFIFKFNLVMLTRGGPASDKHPFHIHKPTSFYLSPLKCMPMAKQQQARAQAQVPVPSTTFPIPIHRRPISKRHQHIQEIYTQMAPALSNKHIYFMFMTKTNPIFIVTFSHLVHIKSH